MVVDAQRVGEVAGREPREARRHDEVVPVAEETGVERLVLRRGLVEAPIDQVAAWQDGGRRRRGRRRSAVGAAAGAAARLRRGAQGDDGSRDDPPQAGADESTDQRVFRGVRSDGWIGRCRTRARRRYFARQRPMGRGRARA
jgi:hypothetical protein